MTRVAAIDCGTNSIRLLVADADPATGELIELDRRMEIVRLGQGVDRTGRLAPDALERTFAACRRYAAVIKEHGAEKLRFVATSASRDAENRDEFVRGVLDILGVEPEVISGDQEAEFSFEGATKELAGRDHLAKPYLVVDIGGGSTEFVVGDDRVLAARSVDIGCVRMTERHLVRDGVVTDPPTLGQITAIRADIDAALDLAEESVPLTEAATLVGLAGTVTTVAAIALGLQEYDSEAIHHSRISFEQVQEITGRLVASTHAERAAIPAMHPGRVDVITSGALVLLAVMKRTGAREVVVSEHDILDGIGWSIA
ncbi:MULTISPECIES: Ppx/GppA phosphatase family protein [Streptomyces]|jgi:exopolyphosphatase/guanosine-5'-triphosphate,3'-diphosphate pyrophosphatase|uniref:Ppx/GppA phosphatase family protein n=1 Tax=unclassified Streptomyces TaxID=2593676 RepID=UPI00088CD04F|nr:MULTISPECIES: Ppx/GppA phosphatase family protein [unclassified Streptomyces]MDX2728619.1 Ppx/GppA phosphatase family protein [Streptomyces sp. PA03-2a]MDX3766215.1 Ppx/GppA phosphatase family protein [Streptomyces sp. AK08-01B]MDX3816529.1 Ppx/GppA phosphatase family protein [Streptomyces sp. AK08-01A]SCZ04723.1 exopolyphosphatase / guanosine-5'-triphosphate,3'-diphosphate pyrophosphatase [Streptomyces sp. 136MFCol5.1]SFT15099.1 exopolyphosphatase / guanosine-5'-triphosphate,3'-diphosphate